MRRRHWTAGAALALVLLGATRAQSDPLETSHLSDLEAAALVVLRAGAFRFTTEARIGERRDWELAMRRHPLLLHDGTFISSQFDHWPKGAPVGFRVTYDPAGRRVTTTLTFGAATASVSNRSSHDVKGDFNELFIRTQAVRSDSSLVVGDLVLDGVPVGNSSSANRPPRRQATDVLRIRGGQLADGFTLTGTITMTWGKKKPEGFELDAQIWGLKMPGGAPPADTTPPALSILAPARDGVLLDSTPFFRATYSDAGSGIDPASVQVRIDGVDRTADFDVTDARAMFAPAATFEEGGHAVEVSVRDRAGNETRSSQAFTVDTVPPALVFLSPSSPVLPGDVTPDIVVNYSDATSGVKPGSLRVSVDGVDLTPSCTVGPGSAQCQSPVLAMGVHVIGASVVDRAGNPRDVSTTLELLPDAEAPVVTIASPADGSLLGTLAPVVTGTAVDPSGVGSVTVNGVAAVIDGSGYQAQVSLIEGDNHLFVLATDVAGNQGFASRSVVVDVTPPAVEVQEPQDGAVVNHPEVRVAGTAEDRHGIASLQVNGQPTALTDGRFEAIVMAAPGENLIVVRAVDSAGNAREETVRITRFAVPQVSITAPQDLATIGATTVDVSGTLSGPGLQVTVDGLAGEVTGTAFIVRDVPLIEGGNILTAVATAADGHVGTDSINVVRDLTPPRVSIDLPLAGASVLEPAVTVAGLVNDIVAGTVNASEATVTVNGRPAEVSNRSFSATGVPLAVGDNTVTVVAVDEVGNTGQASIIVRRLAPAGRRLSMVSGDGQQGVIGTALAQPLVVSLVDAAGAPVAGVPVVFEIRGNNGRLDGAARQRVVATDAAGRAEVRFTLGTRAGVANQRVEASAAGFAGTAVFAASALPGPAASIVVDAGDQQVGAVGQALPLPLVAAVIDAGNNRLEGVAVRFTAIRGRGRFENGLAEITAITDSDGRAIVPFLLDPEEGVANNVVEAVIDGLAGGPFATFVATGWVSREAAATAVSGVVLDNQNQPIEGVTLRVLETTLTAHTDALGQFRIAGVPPGTVKLIVDGSTANRPGSWPDLEFVLTAVAGRDNTVNMPIYLLPLDLGNGLPVDEIRGGVVTLPEIPGFALEIAPGSVTFPGGSRSGMVSVTAVHSDKVPMVPNFGQQPRFIVTIQPAGARFEPPARLTLPNVEGLAPGEVTEFYSFDHDLGHFVSIGPATVSDDGLVVVSNPGVGIVKAGWHCGGNPSRSGTAANCPTCQRCSNNVCVPNDGPSCNDGDDCTTRDRCRGGSCAGDRRQIDSLQATANGQRIHETYIERTVNFQATVQSQTCQAGDLTYTWDFADGESGTGAAPTHKFKKPGVWNAQVTAKCRTCDTKTAVASVIVRCPEIRITATNPDVSILCPGCEMQFTAEADPAELPVKFVFAPGGDLGGRATITSEGLLRIAADAPTGTVVVRATVTDNGEHCYRERSIFVFVPPDSSRIGPFTQDEIAWATRHPRCALENINLEPECWAEMRRNIPVADQEDPGPGNAFLHAFCNCTMARRCGVAVAQEFWNAHEQHNRNSCQNSSMDFHNNEIGRQVSSGSGTCTDEVLGALRNGQLRFMDRQYGSGECPEFRQ